MENKYSEQMNTHRDTRITLMTRFTLFSVIFMLTSHVFASAQTIGQQTVGSNTGYAIPRFASLASNLVNMRKGPSEDYEIIWQFVQDNMPVQIIFEQEEWRKVRTFDGTTGWMHRSVLSGGRTGIITTQTPLHKKPEQTAARRAILTPNVVVLLNECQQDWCKVNIRGLSGWISKRTFWGITPDELL